MTETSATHQVTFARGEDYKQTPCNRYAVELHKPGSPESTSTAWRWIVSDLSNFRNQRGGYCATKSDAVSDANKALGWMISESK